MRLWPWEVKHIEDMAWYQRGSDKLKPTPKPILPRPEGKPQMLGPKMFHDEGAIPRAGMASRSRQDPKSVMMAWADQKIRDEAPEAQGKTISMIMRAEPRTVTAIMHAKSPSQTREVIIPAFKRAGLPSPFHPIPQPSPTMELEPIMKAIAEQTTITDQIAQILAEAPKAKNYEDLVGFMQESQASYIKAVEALATSVARLEHTMTTWEHAIPYLS